MRTSTTIVLLTIFVFGIQGTISADTISELQQQDRYTKDGLPYYGTTEAPDPFNKIDLHKPVITVQTKCLGKNKDGYGVKPYLCIQYPWAKIQNASIEIRIVGPESHKRPQCCKPLYFMTTLAQIPVIERDLVQKSLHRPGTTNNIEYDKSIFTIEGLPRYELVLASIKNLTGNDGLFYHVRLVNSETKELDTTLVFPELQNWAVDDNILALELRGKQLEFDKAKREFEQPCEIKVWFLKGDAIVWEETVQWPGVSKDDKKRVNNGDRDKDPQMSARYQEAQEKKNNRSED